MVRKRVPAAVRIISFLRPTLGCLENRYVRAANGHSDCTGHVQHGPQSLTVPYDLVVIHDNPHMRSLRQEQVARSATPSCSSAALLSTSARRKRLAHFVHARAGLRIRTKVKSPTAIKTMAAASQLPAAAMPPAAAHVIEEKASENVATRDDV